jgi:hypothetical protein
MPNGPIKDGSKSATSACGYVQVRADLTQSPIHGPTRDPTRLGHPSVIARMTTDGNDPDTYPTEPEAYA